MHPMVIILTAALRVLVIMIAQWGICIYNHNYVYLNVSHCNPHPF